MWLFFLLTISTASIAPPGNTNIQYLFSLPMERVRLFPGDAPDGIEPLLPDWMRHDMNMLALRLYGLFLSQLDVKKKDYRDAEWTLKQFRDWQMNQVATNDIDKLRSLLDNDDDDDNNKKKKTYVTSFEGLRNLLAKIGTDFTHKMGFTGGTKYMYKARLWAEVMGSGDAVAPTFMAGSGAQITGVIHTHIPSRLKGNPVFEILDPRGHNPPFGQDERITAVPGTMLLFPAWATRMVPPHRCCRNDLEPSEIEKKVPLLATHRIDWVVEIGLFQYPMEELVKFVDWESCPFKESYSNYFTQSHFDLNLPDLISLGPPPELQQRLSSLKQQSR